MGRLLRWQFRLAHRLLDAAFDELAGDTRSRTPAGAAARAAACYAQAVLVEDLSVHGVLAGGRPLAFSSWAGRTGMSVIPPLGGPLDRRGRARRVRVDVARLRPYARAVHAATDAYLAALPERGLQTLAGETPACLLSALLLTLAARRGKIASLCPRPAARA